MKDDYDAEAESDDDYEDIPELSNTESDSDTNSDNTIEDSDEEIEDFSIEPQRATGEINSDGSESNCDAQSAPKSESQTGKPISEQCQKSTSSPIQSLNQGRPGKSHIQNGYGISTCR